MLSLETKAPTTQKSCEKYRAFETNTFEMSALPSAPQRCFTQRATQPHAEEVAAAVVYLDSDASSGLQASELVVHGGTSGALAGSPRYILGDPRPLARGKSRMVSDLG